MEYQEEKQNRLNRVSLNGLAVHGVLQVSPPIYAQSPLLGFSHHQDP